MLGNFTYNGITGQAAPLPLTRETLWVLGRAPAYENVYFNFGHWHWGVTHGAVSANIILDLINGKTPEINIRPHTAELSNSFQRLSRHTIILKKIILFALEFFLILKSQLEVS